MNVLTRTVIGIALLTAAAPTGPAWATSQMMAATKSAGLPAKNCQYCHTEAMPKKQTFKPEALNERGKFLLSDMTARKLKAPDIDKLKEFPGGPEQK